MSIVLSLYPEKFGYSLGGYSHRERCRAPDRKKLVKKRMKKLRRKNYWRMRDISIIVFISSTTNFDYIVNKINIAYSHREIFMKAAKDNSDILYIETVKQGCEI
jgi:hypothetical protein